MFCNSCGSKLDQGTTFCPECGEKVESSSANQKSLRANKKGNNQTTNVSLKNKASSDSIKKNVTYSIFWISIFAVSVIINLLFRWALTYEGGIWVKSIFDGDVKKSISLLKVTDHLYNGFENFLPTVSSTILSTLIYALFYSLPVITVIMLLGVFITKAKKTWLTALSVVNVLSAITLAVSVPIELKFIPHVVSIIGSEVSIMTEDIGSISYPVPIVFAILIIIFVVVSHILLLSLLRRKENEKLNTNSN